VINIQNQCDQNQCDQNQYDQNQYDWSVINQRNIHHGAKLAGFYGNAFSPALFNKLWAVYPNFLRSCKDFFGLS